MLKVTTVSDLLQCPGDDRLADIGLKGSKDESGSCYIAITMPLLSASIMTLLLVFTGVIRTIKRGSIKLKVNKKDLHATPLLVRLHVWRLRVASRGWPRKRGTRFGAFGIRSAVNSGKSDDLELLIIAM